ncbi:MAG: tetratricopeptide repeat protein [Leptolyngbyaceae cyanobacterium RM1_406_9]|nr:tetratricopeptide repeat protein [Leptolyngbyaceae cyanobacterium RM1_406_9]
MAIDNYQRILTVAREIGDRQSEGIALGSLGITYNSLGQYKQAIAQQNRLLSVVERLAIARVKAMR